MLINISVTVFVDFISVILNNDVCTLLVMLL